jgi:GT2 family glycosyltransferase
VTFNSAPVLDDFLASLNAQIYRSYTLYVVDNASTDNTCSMLDKQMPQGGVLLRNQDNKGFAAGTNQGIRRALADDCDAILLLNNDVVFGPGLLEQLVAGIREHNCDMTTPLMYYQEPGNRIWAAGGAMQPRLARCVHRGHNRIDSGQYRSACRVTFAPFCCVLITRRVFDRVGMLDESYFTYMEDADFMYRCLQADLALWYIPEAALWHKVSSLTGFHSPFSIRYGTRNRAYFIARHVTWPWRQILNLAYPAYFLLRLVVGLDTRERYRMRIEAWAEGRQMLRRKETDRGESNCSSDARYGVPEKSA